MNNDGLVNSNRFRSTLNNYFISCVDLFKIGIPLCQNEEDEEKKSD